MAKEKKNFLIGVYDDDDKILHAVSSVQRQGISIEDCFTPFPVHGLDHALGLKESRIPSVGFIGGALGTVTALSMMVYMYTIDWPVDIGGKPNLPFPSFIPITFELTVLFCSLAMVFTYLYINRLSPAQKPELCDPRQTDDRFVIRIEAGDAAHNQKVLAALRASGAIEVREQEMTVRV
ncbi:MAG: DUF3341 domain-containing protein [Bacteroidetes bacterium]|jgi:hypothetical protein|nr:DUF3341 domain-containing protein [Bacteroidota bacterium]